MLKRVFPLVVLLSALIFIGGCTTIINGSSQEIGISSIPSDADVIVDGVPLGVTPVVATLKRKNTHIVVIEKPGYEKYEITLVKRTSGWVWGNIVFGGLIGLGIDAITGSLYKLTPDQVTAVLSNESSSATITEDGIYVFLVKNKQNEYEKIGSLE